MKKILVLTVLAVFAAFIITGCGGSQQINSAGDAAGQAAGEAQQANKENLPNTYVVESGDTIYGIAAKSEIYGNKYQWPLIYDANRDILDSYEKLSEGTRLIIPRDVDAAKIEEAIKRAEELNYPPKEAASAETIESGSVAGMESRDIIVEKKSKAASEKIEQRQESSSAGETQVSEEMPSVPEPAAPAAKAKKKGGINGGVLIILLLLVAGVAAMYVFFQKKKKEEEEEENMAAEKKDDNILS